MCLISVRFDVDVDGNGFECEEEEEEEVCVLDTVVRFMLYVKCFFFIKK